MKFKPNDEVEIVGNTGGHNQVGFKMTVSHYQGGVVKMKESAFNFPEPDLKLIPLDKNKFLKRAELAKREWLLNQAKADFLETTGDDVLDERKFRRYNITTLIENNKLTLQEKVERIDSMFEGD